MGVDEKKMLACCSCSCCFVGGAVGATATERGGGNAERVRPVASFLLALLALCSTLLQIFVSLVIGIDIVRTVDTYLD